MKVYVATSGSYSDYRICQVFKRESDALAYVADLEDGDVMEMTVRTGPVEKRTFWHLWYDPDWKKGTYPSFNDNNPSIVSYVQDYEPERNLSHRWSTNGFGRTILTVEGWSEEDVMKVYREQRGMYDARKAGIA